VHSDVPVGAGLSSSAALECSVAVAVADLIGLALDDDTRHRIVRASMRAEGEVAGAPTGGMDQTISVFGRADSACLIDCSDWSLEQLPWAPQSAGLELLVIDTKAHHELTDGGYADRRAACEQAASVLGVRTLREVTDPQAALAALDDPVLVRRTRHVLTEMARVTESVADLRAGDYRAFATCLARSHASLRHDFEVSCDELDVTVETCLTAGALGARMTGGGFGGSAIAVVPQERVSAVTQAVTLAFAKAGWSAPGFLLARAGDGAGRLDQRS
jgi:galactokinase